MRFLIFLVITVFMTYNVAQTTLPPNLELFLLHALVFSMNLFQNVYTLRRLNLESTIILHYITSHTM